MDTFSVVHCGARAISKARLVQQNTYVGILLGIILSAHVQSKSRNRLLIILCAHVGVDYYSSVAFFRRGIFIMTFREGSLSGVVACTRA